MKPSAQRKNSSIDAVFLRADNLRAAGDYPSASRAYRSIALAAAASDNYKFRAMCAVGDCLRITGDISAAKKIYLSALRRISTSKSGRSLSGRRLSADDTAGLADDARTGAALCDKAAGKYSAALLQLKKLLSDARRRGDKEAEGFILWHIGMCLRFKGDLPAAAGALRESKKIFARLRRSDGEGFALCGLGGALRAGGDVCRSLESYRAAGRIFARTRDAYGKAYSLCGTANALKALGRSREALALYKRSAAIYARTGDFSSLAFVYKGIGGCLETLSGKGKGAASYGRAAVLFRRARDERGLLSLYLEMLSKSFDKKIYAAAFRLAASAPYVEERKYLKRISAHRGRAAVSRSVSAPKWLG
ncbi:MAG: hypothetical protein CVU77_08475 [Elusimicrobia bacterium HGW-Elusimicrobia-1]|nr:MAG: hypothetical protein CVU77_08475 [Elusimicrobia bacterium HGW-Elusimicrobia-1]